MVKPLMMSYVAVITTVGADVVDLGRRVRRTGDVQPEAGIALTDTYGVYIA